jgi:hypothetical protein
MVKIFWAAKKLDKKILSFMYIIFRRVFWPLLTIWVSNFGLSVESSSKAISENELKFESVKKCFLNQIGSEADESKWSRRSFQWRHMWHYNPISKTLFPMQTRSSGMFAWSRQTENTFWLTGSFWYVYILRICSYCVSICVGNDKILVDIKGLWNNKIISWILGGSLENNQDRLLVNRHYIMTVKLSKIMKCRMLKYHECKEFKFISFKKLISGFCQRNPLWTAGNPLRFLWQIIRWKCRHFIWSDLGICFTEFSVPHLHRFAKFIIFLAI